MRDLRRGEPGRRDVQLPALHPGRVPRRGDPAPDAVVLDLPVPLVQRGEHGAHHVFQRKCEQVNPLPTPGRRSRTPGSRTAPLRRRPPRPSMGGNPCPDPPAPASSRLRPVAVSVPGPGGARREGPVRETGRRAGAGEVGCSAPMSGAWAADIVGSGRAGRPGRPGRPGRSGRSGPVTARSAGNPTRSAAPRQRPHRTNGARRVSTTREEGLVPTHDENAGKPPAPAPSRQSAAPRPGRPGGCADRSGPTVPAVGRRAEATP